MNSSNNLKIVMTGLGDRHNGNDYLKSSFVRIQMNSIKPYLKKALPFAITNTTSLIGVSKNFYELRKFLNAFQPDLVHAQYGSTTALVTFLSAYKRFPFIISFCGNDLIKYPSSNPYEYYRVILATYISKFCSRFADSIIVKSKNLFNALPASVKSKTHILPNGVDLSHFRPIPKLEARKILRLNPKSPIILFSKTKGSETIKCPKLAYAVFSLIKQRVNDAILLEIGNESYENMPHYLNASDVLLLTSLYEGSPNMIKEAMACNLPVVSVDCGDVSERLKNVSPGGVFNRDPELVAQEVEKIIVSKGLSNGRIELEKQGLSLDNIAHKLINIYLDTLRSKK